MALQGVISGTKAIQIRVDEDLHKMLRLYCAHEGKTIQALLEEYIREVTSGLEAKARESST